MSIVSEAVKKQKNQRQISFGNFTSFKQIIIMGQITGTLILDNTLKALALIN